MKLDELTRLTLSEDLPSGEDVTTDLLVENPGVKTKAYLVAKEDLVLSGLEPFEQCFRHIEPSVRINWFFKPGDMILNQQKVALLEGELQTLLKGERSALNFLGHLSGVATLTRCFVEAAKEAPQPCSIVDTRKTLPLLRALQKQAVRDGGGKNHRMHLGDEILIKENHRKGLKDLALKLDQLARRRPELRITIECRNIEEVRQAIDLPLHCVLLDNMTLENMKEALQLIPARIETEASGNMTIDRVREVAKLGINRISVGAITHSAPNADFSLLISPHE